MTGQDETATTTTTTTTNGWDLTGQIAPYLDRHMVFPLLEFVEPQYNTQDIVTARLALLRPTHMVDYAMDTYKSVHGGGSDDANVPIPNEMIQQKESVFQALKDLTQRCQPFEELIQSTEDMVRCTCRNERDREKKSWSHVFSLFTRSLARSLSLSCICLSP
jgi:hypothetical protein